MFFDKTSCKMPCKVVIPLGVASDMKLVLYAEPDDLDNLIQIYLCKTTDGGPPGTHLIMEQKKFPINRFLDFMTWCRDFVKDDKSFEVGPDFEKTYTETEGAEIRVWISQIQLRSLVLTKFEVLEILELEDYLTLKILEGIDFGDCNCSIESGFFVIECGAL